MQLERLDGQRRQQADTFEHAVAGFSGQADHQVDGNFELACGSSLDGGDATGKIVAAIDPGQYGIVAGFDTYFQFDDVL
ncbi:hypothetical protein GALL_495840 [mine drainage metagenome]|uniref:Uncharacterized protein n=1 Tax=mine drainage metagenome TaxID=410659 RepID=A0A1J5PU57_9ZZZZ